ncbi:MAG: serine protease [Flammeovirgaceae bacterium]|jgi:membrane-bound serine protease (ClpP class)|nr:serine protease [Flammeovirgaceae bacterium]|tara:strand:- start:1440 stop:2777 length:1338 start_codon:yes stop_codon:yes gene_type:complete
MYSNIFKLFILFIAPILICEAESEKKKILLGEIKANIDPRTNRYTKLLLEEGKKNQYDIIIIEMDTYGGAVNDADDIRTRILDYDKPIYVWINKDAASAGALISIACDSIYMSSGASIGAATVVTGDGEQAPDKYQSYMRSIMRSTAEAKGRDPKIAEGMVDEDLQVDSVSQEGKVITFSTNEAIKFGFCDAELNSVEEILERQNIEDYEISKFSLGSTENIISLFLNPFVSGILLLLIFGGLYFELQTPGVGFPIIASITALLLYLIPYYLNGVAENWEIILLFFGIILIAVEVFIIPGFGVFGLLGLFTSISSLILIMLNNDLFDFTFVVSSDIVSASLSVLISIFLLGIIILFGGIKLTDTDAFKKIALEETQDSKKGYISNNYPKEIVGKIGKSFTILRPSGKVIIDDSIYDATSSDGFVEKNSKIKVIGNEGSALKVRKV